MSEAPELGSAAAVYAVMGARLRKVSKGVACTAREPVLFGAHQGGPVREHLAALLKSSLGAFALERCKEIRKQAIVYAAILPDDTAAADLGAIVSLIYGAVPFAPRHHSMPPAYTGPPVRILNTGRVPGLPAEIKFGVDKHLLDPDQTRVGEANLAMAQAMARDAVATRALAPEDVGIGGLATERVARPEEVVATEKVAKPDGLIDTEKVDKEGVGSGIVTERVLRPTDHVDDTEFVPRPPATA